LPRDERVAVRFCSVALCCIICARHRRSCLRLASISPIATFVCGSNEQTVRALAREFSNRHRIYHRPVGNPDVVPDAPEIMRGMPEVAAYPENAVGETLININLAPDQEG
jgi:hypothetical protein